MYQSFYTDILQNAIDNPDLPDELIISYIDNAEIMQLTSWYALAIGTSPDAVRLRCLIQKRLLQIGGSSAPDPTPECIALGLVSTSAIRRNNNLPIVAPPSNNSLINIGSGGSGTNTFNTGTDSHIKAPSNLPSPILNPQQNPEQNPQQNPEQNPEQNPQQNPQQNPVQNPVQNLQSNQQNPQVNQLNSQVNQQNPQQNLQSNQQSTNVANPPGANPTSPTIFYIIGGVVIVIIILILLLKK